MNKQQVINMLQEKQRKVLELTAQGYKAPLVLTPLEANQIMTALVAGCGQNEENTELLRELTQIVGEQV